MAAPSLGNEQAALTEIPSTARRCLVSGEVLPKESLVRFVVGPEGQIVPDVAGRLPGRGMWVSAQHAVLAQAIAKKAFARAAKAKVRIPEDLIEQTQKLLERRCMDLLGLARSAGAVVTGQPQVEHALSQDALSYILLAADAGRDCRKKLSRATLIDCGFDRAVLGAALGHEHLACVGLRPHSLSKKLKMECVRWQGVAGAQDMTLPEDTTKTG